MEKERLRIGQRVAQARKESGITLKQLSDATGINKSTINQIELGKQNATIDTLCKIATALGKRITIELN